MKVCVLTLGCKMNEVESASLMRGLEERGHETTDELGRADLYLINTCAVTAEAERKSRQAVARVRKFNPSAQVGNHTIGTEAVTAVLNAQKRAGSRPLGCGKL